MSTSAPARGLSTLEAALSPPVRPLSASFDMVCLFAGMDASAPRYALDLNSLDAFISTVLRSSPWPCLEQCLGGEENDEGMPGLLRELWRNDQQQLSLLQV